MARSCTFYCLPSLLDPFIPRQEPWGGSGMPAGVQSRNPEIGRRHGENTYRFFWFYYHNLTYTNSSITKKMIWLWVNSYFYTIWMWVIHIHLFTSYDLGFTQLGTRVPSPHPLGMITILGEPRPIRWPTRTFHCGTLRDGRGCRNWAILMLQGRFFS